MILRQRLLAKIKNMQQSIALGLLFLILLAAAMLNTLQRTIFFQDPKAFGTWIENIKLVWNAPTPTLPEGRPRLELSYDNFVDLVEKRRVSRALIPFSRGNAQVVLTDGRRAYVELINDKKLLDILSEHDVDFSVRPK